MRICVFCSSSDELDNKFYDDADKLGGLIAKNGHSLVHGGGKIGLMGSVSGAVRKAGGTVKGVIPEKLMIKGVYTDDPDELIITADMPSRKEKMREISDAYVALPGGFGTLEEISEVITLKQLKYLSGAIVFLNTNGFYNELLSFYEKMYSGKFAHPEFRKLYFVAGTPAEVIDYLHNYSYIPFRDRYL